MNEWALPHRMAQCGASVREIADLLGVHPHHLDEDALHHLPELPTRVLIELARRLDLHPADLAPGLEPVLAHPRQDAEPDSEDPTIEADARVVLAAWTHAGTPLHTYTLCQVLDWPHPRLRAGAHTYVLGARWTCWPGSSGPRWRAPSGARGRSGRRSRRPDRGRAGRPRRRGRARRRPGRPIQSPARALTVSGGGDGGGALTSPWPSTNTV
jgi:hypothetical protein